MAARPSITVVALALGGCTPTLPKPIGSDSGDPRPVTTVGPARDSGDASTTTEPEPEPGPGPCGLSVALTERFFTEGDTVTFDVSCASGVLAEASLSMAGAGDGATLDGTSGAFRWVTDGRSGGRYDVTIAAAAPDGLETANVTFWVADSATADNARAPQPLDYTEEWGLPVVHIEMDAALTEEEQDATITVRSEQVTGFAKIRGASSTYYPKRSYTLDFVSDELAVTEWGDRSREHMVLITSFDDNSYVRQKLGYDLWMAMAEHSGDQRLTPRTFFTVVYINGEYQGLYTACDRIDDEFLRHMGTEGEGSLYKSVSHDANFYRTDAGGRTKTWLGVGYEKKEGDPEDWNDLYALVGLTGESDDESLWNNHPGIEMEEFADWMLWAQLTLAQDSAGKNAYLFADPVAERWRFAPWDLNESWGQNWYTLRLSATTRNDYYWNNRVFYMLQEYPEARSFVEARYALYSDGGPFQTDVIHTMIDDYVTTLGPNIDRDWARWEDQYRAFDRWRGSRDSAGDWTTPAEELAYVKSWIAERLDMYEADGPI